MNEECPQHKAIEPNPEAAGLALMSSGQQRRRLLRTVAATGAIVGVGLPMAAHATVRPHCKKTGDANPNNNYHPTASAVGSLIGSATGGVPPIAGHNCGHYYSVGNWGSGWTNGRPAPKTLTHSNCASSGGSTRRTFAEVFEVSSPTTAQARECWNIINNYSTSDEAIWLTALFNANKRVPFAYTASQVVDLYKGINPLGGNASGATLRDNARLLFKDYLSSLG